MVKVGRLANALAVAACLVVFSACGSAGAGTASPSPTLSRVASPTDPAIPVKTAGRVLAVLSPQLIKVQIEPRNENWQVVYDNAVILLRSSEKTAFVWATLGQSIKGPSASSMGDLAVGETITFAFEPRSEDPTDHSFLAGTIGRTPKGG